MPDAFLTGGTGFVGGGVLAALVADGRDVVALARDDAGRERVEALGARPAAGDVLDGASLAAAATGCRTFFHVAGINEHCSHDPGLMYRVNVDGAVNAVRAAAAAGAGRVVLTSSTAAIGERKGEVGNESTEHSGSHLTDYARSKAHGERAARAEAERLGVDLVVVNPASVQGPGRVDGTAEILLAYLRGRLPAAIETTVSMVFADDCAAGHLLAEANGEPGERYILSGATFSVREALRALAAATGVEHRVRFLPAWTAVAAGAVIGPLWRLRGTTPPLCLESARAIAHGHRFDGSKATRHLGLTYTPFEEALRRTVEWYRQEGLLYLPPHGAVDS